MAARMLADDVKSRAGVVVGSSGVAYRGWGRRLGVTGLAAAAALRSKGSVVLKVHHDLDRLSLKTICLFEGLVYIYILETKI